MQLNNLLADKQQSSFFNEIKIDIGLSSNAPQSSKWLEDNENLLVIGVEPNHRSLMTLLTGESNFSNQINPRLIDDRLLILPYAISNDDNFSQRLFHHCQIGNDSGQSSLLDAVDNRIKKLFSYRVNTIKLELIISTILAKTSLNLVSHVKSDCQGFDYQVLISAGSHLSKIAVYTFEYEPHQYAGSCDYDKYDTFLKSNNFIPVNHTNCKKLGLNLSMFQTDDPTYINMTHLEYIKRYDNIFYQKG